MSETDGNLRMMIQMSKEIKKLETEIVRLKDKESIRDIESSLQQAKETDIGRYELYDGIRIYVGSKNNYDEDNTDE